MISADNKPSNHLTSDGDFNVNHYRSLIKLARNGYEVVSYRDIPWGTRFLLWRHDVDYSLNRSLALAKIEHQEGLKSTFFINPHSNFYNIAEASQHRIIKEIISLGHDIGLHFDSAFFDIQSEKDLDQCIHRDADYIDQLFDKRPIAFSFHNPAAAQFNCEANEYGGLINCYSKRFKSDVAYCSDSNGFWRFRRLHDVVSEAKDDCLQVLTHPGWWLENSIPPRQRIFRAINGRAAAILRFYDDGLVLHGRVNHSGGADALSILKDTNPSNFELCDYLWNQYQFETLFLELWRILELQIINLCKEMMIKLWKVSAAEFERFLSQCDVPLCGWKLVHAIIEKNSMSSIALDECEYKTCYQVSIELMRGRSSCVKSNLESGCYFLCECIQSFATWGKQHPIKFDGLSVQDYGDTRNLKTVEAEVGGTSGRAMLSNSEVENEEREKLKSELIDLINEAS